MKRNNKTSGSSLFSPRARGGVIGGAGYNFQDAYIVTALPTWLGDQEFRSVIKEGFDDVDVRFENARGAWTWHYQLKDHEITVAEFREVLTSFASAARRTGVNATSFILGCCGLVPTLLSLWNRIREFRGARQSYSEAALEATKEELLTQIAKLRLTDYADLLIDKVEIDYETPGLHDTEPRVLIERFRGKFITLPLYHHEPAEVLDQLFTRLMARVNRAIRVGLSRDDLETLIRTELTAAAKGRATVVYLHGWVRQAYDLPADIEIDWTRYFDHAALRVPTSEVWQKELLPELRELRERLDREGDRRSIWLRAKAPLSAGLAFGHAFAEAAGYSISVEQLSPGTPGALQHWRTDAPVEGDAPLELREVEGDATNDEVVVGIGITDDPQPKVEQYLGQAGLRARPALYISPAGGPSATSVNEKNVGALGAGLKRELHRFTDRHAARLIHLFYFGPLGLAVLLGQKLNGLADIQCYERNKTVGYAPSCRLPA